MKPEPDSREVELAKQGFAAFSRGEWDASLATMHPDVEWHLAFPLPDLPPDKTIFRGRGEVKELWGVFASIWETISLEIEEVEGEGGDEEHVTVVARSRFRGTGGASGIEVDRVVHYVLDIDPKAELLRRVRPFDTRDEAMAAAGLG